jgi:isopenicillin N synthase-like dioxygenase
MIFSPSEFDSLRALAFQPDYAGYRPNVKEIPNGDGKVDAEKRFSHVASKYLRGDSDSRLWQALYRCHDRAMQVANLLDLPSEWRPNLNASALRVLEYPPGAGSERHTDFDLFTLLAYRDPLEGLEIEGDPLAQERPEVERTLQQLAPGLHFGELAEFLPEPIAANPHYVDPMNRWQFSAVYFALPHPETKLPDGRLVSGWLAERIARSRVYA